MKILFTTALIPSFYEQRRLEYIESFDTISNFFTSEDIKILECYSQKTKSFLDDFICEDIFFSETNREIRNLGVKEALAIKAFIDQTDLDDNEIIVKLTGRYKLTSNYIIEEIYKNPEIDAFVRSGTGPQYFTGFFAMRFLHFKTFFRSLDLEHMEKNMINIEAELFRFLEKEGIKKIVYDRIDVFSNINNTDKVNW